VALNTPVTFDDTRNFALAIGQLLERDHPDLITTNMSKDVRPGKIFVDWSQNVASKTTIAVYSLRARAQPTASTPVSWEEVETALAEDDGTALRFEAHEVLERVARHGDLFAPLLTLEQELPGLLR
jgi:bifunctional non-homologous end joining protein LigD